MRLTVHQWDCGDPFLVASGPFSAFDQYLNAANKQDKSVHSLFCLRPKALPGEYNKQVESSQAVIIVSFISVATITQVVIIYSRG